MHGAVACSHLAQAGVTGLQIGKERSPAVGSGLVVLILDLLLVHPDHRYIVLLRRQERCIHVLAILQHGEVGLVH